MPGIIIQSNNFNGKSVQITFSPFSGGSINLGTQVIPYTYTTSNYEGDYSIYIPSSDKTCSLQVGTPPSPTPTSTITPTPTLTPTNTPTNTPTPTLTPTPSSTPSSLDPDAAAYLADIVISGGTITPTIESAVDTLFISLKSSGFYSKMIAMYPFVGATAASHAINATLNKSYDVIWNGGVSHDISGSTGNGTNGYGNTNFSWSSYTSVLDSTFGMYLITTGSTLNESSRHGMGGSPFEGAGLQFGNIGGGFYRHGNGSPSSPQLVWSNYSTPNNQLGMFISVRQLAGSSRVFQNAVGIRNHGIPCTPTQNFPFSIGAITNGTGQLNWNNTKMNFLFFANNIAEVDVPSLTTIINTFQTSLGRNTY